MILKLLVTGEEFLYKETYIKGKKFLVEYRFLFEHLSDGEFHKKGDEELFYIDAHPMFGMDYTFIKGCFINKIQSGHIKFKNYNYYLLNNNITVLEKELTNYKLNRKLFFTGKQGLFDTTYRPTFEFNSNLY